MPVIVDYTSLGKAITDFAHRQDIASYQDYFIQGAIEQIQNDVFDLNFGNGVRFMGSELRAGEHRGRRDALSPPTGCPPRRSK